MGKEMQELDNTKRLIEYSELLLPWWFTSGRDILKRYTERYPESYLNGFYIYPVLEFSIESGTKDISRFINQRFQTLFSAASGSNISIMLTIHSRNGNTRIYLGLKSNKSNKEQFTALLNGIIPGRRIEYDETVRVSSMYENYKYGGIVTGVPAIKIDDERQRINLSSVIRALYGKNYTLSIISAPLSDRQRQIAFAELLRVRDELHQIARQTIGYEKGFGTSYSESESITHGRSETVGQSIGLTLGMGMPMGPAWSILFISGFPPTLFAAGTYSSSYSETTSESRTIGNTYTTSETETRSLSIEQQNGIALELEKIADQYIERYIKGFNSGLWETTISFSANDKTTCDILGGTLIGELSKPSNKLLPPPLYYVDRLEPKQYLFIPKDGSLKNPIFPKILSSYVTSEELAVLSSTPTESVPGFEIREMPKLSLTDIDRGEYILGNIADHGNPVPNTYFYITKKDLNKHVFIGGLTGSGKTTTVKHILKHLSQDNIPFLVLESAKRDYRQLLADESFKDLKVFTIGDATVSPIRFNPFYVQEGVHPLVHIEYLKAIFNASFSLYGPMPHIVEKCLHNIYIKKGWDLTNGTHPHFLKSNGEIDETKYQKIEHYYVYPTLNDLKEEVRNYINREMEYRGELRDNIKTAILARLESLSVGAKGLMFNTYDFYPISELLKQSVVFEMEDLADDDEKAFFLGLILVLISEYRQRENPAKNPGMKDVGLKHFLVIEEAHRLLKNVHTERVNEMLGNPKGKAVEAFSNVISEMRSLGQGVCVVEQIPTKISPDVIKNSNMKIVHRLVSKDDQSLLAGSLGITDEEALYLNRLKTGYALCHKEGMARPVECAIIKDFKSHAQSDYKIHKLMEKDSRPILHPFKAYEIGDRLSNKGTEICVRFLNSLVVAKDIKLKEFFEEVFNKLKLHLKLANVKEDISWDVFSSYCVKELVKLFTSGMYCVRPKLPDGFVDTLNNLIKNGEISSYEKLIGYLKVMWNTEQPEEFVVDAIKELLKRHIMETGSKITEKDIAEFFLNPSDENIQKTVLKIKKYFEEVASND